MCWCMIGGRVIGLLLGLVLAYFGVSVVGGGGERNSPPEIVAGVITIAFGLSLVALAAAVL